MAQPKSIQLSMRSDAFQVSRIRIAQRLLPRMAQRPITTMHLDAFAWSFLLMAPSLRVRLAPLLGLLETHSPPILAAALQRPTKLESHASHVPTRWVV